MTTKLYSAGLGRTLALVLVLSVGSGTKFSMADPTDTSQPPVSDMSDQGAAQDAAAAQAPAPTMTPEQLESLVAPIALYPDPLISQILVASTYPLELVQAGQWLEQHPELQGQALKDAAAQQSWDPSVQALVLFPDVIKRLNSDVTWTNNLGNAFLGNQGSVMDAIQRMRARADQAGKLNSTAQAKITKTVVSGQPIIEIQPADPEIIYVPVYNPVWIWGPGRYYYPAWYYPPPPPFGVWFFWGPAFRMTSYYPGWRGYGGWGGWGWRPGWHDHAVIVNRAFITNNHYNVVNVRTFHNNSVWVHNPGNRFGAVPGRGNPTFARPTVNQVQQQFHQRATSPGLPPDRIGNRAVMPNAATRNRSAFDGSQHGSNARVFGSRGRSSLGHRAAGGANKPSYIRGGGRRGGGERDGGNKDGGFGGGRGR